MPLNAKLKITRDYRKQGNMFTVYQYGRLLAMFVYELHADIFICELHDRQRAAHSSAAFEPFEIKTAFIQI